MHRSFQQKSDPQIQLEWDIFRNGPAFYSYPQNTTRRDTKGTKANFSSF